MLPTSPYYIVEKSNIKRWGYLHRHAPMATEVTSKDEVTYIAILHGDKGNIKNWGYLYHHWCYLHRHRCYVHRHAAMAREVTSKCEVTYIAILHGDRGNIKKRGYLHRHWCYLHRQAPMAREVISKCEVTYIAMLPGDRGNIRPYLCRQGATRELIPTSCRFCRFSFGNLNDNLLTRVFRIVLFAKVTSDLVALFKLLLNWHTLADISGLVWLPIHDSCPITDLKESLSSCISSWNLSPLLFCSKYCILSA